MLILYNKPGCPYCAMVIKVLDELGLSYEKKDAYEPAIAQELIARGGKNEAPYLVDTDRGVEMYDENDIIAYLREHYGTQPDTETAGGVPHDGNGI